MPHPFTGNTKSDANKSRANVRRWTGRINNQFRIATLLLLLDFIGTLVFALEGASAAIRADLDIFGVLVLAFVTALGGGIIRDLLIGGVPPSAIRDWRYPAIAFTGGAAAFFFNHSVQGIPTSVMILLDAAGLSLFAIAGATKALTFNIHPFMAVLMGAVTGAGGGTVRDICLAQVPTVLRADVYASAALAGSIVTVVGLRLKLPAAWMTFAGAVVCFLLRMISVWEHLSLPRLAGHR